MAKSAVQFNKVLLAYSKLVRHNQDAHKCASRLLERIKGSKHVKPDVVTYTLVMECWARSGEPDAALRALQLFEELKRLYRDSGNDLIRPNTRTYGVAIWALSASPQPGGALRARQLLEELVKQYELTGDASLKPTTHVYNHVMNCAANTEYTDQEEKIAAFKVAAQTYQDLRTADIQADSYTYAFWFKACNSLLTMSDYYCNCIKLPLGQCKRDGLLTEEVLKKIQQGHLTGIRLAEMLEVDTSDAKMVEVDDLDPAWSRNVPHRR